MSIRDKLEQAVAKVKDVFESPTATTEPGQPGPIPTEPPGPGAPDPSPTPAPTPPPPLPEPNVQPSSTPDGPATIPAPSTPLGEPGPDPQGGMGVSSERVPHDPDSLEGTGSHGTAVDTADGYLPPAQAGSPSAVAGEESMMPPSGETP